MEDNQQQIKEKYNEIKQLYAQLKKSEERFRSIFENIQDIYFETALDGTILEVSPSIEQLSQYKRDELIGKNVESIYSDKNDRENFLNNLQTSQQVADYELNLKNKDGSIAICSITAKLFFNEQAIPTKIVGIIRDISERKKAESEHQQLEEQLRQSEKLKGISRLAGGIAHYFKNQLFGMASYARLIKRHSNKDQKICTYADKILSSSKRSSSLVKQLLAFAVKDTITLEMVNIHTLISEVISILQQSIDTKILIKKYLSASQTFIKGDPTQLQYMLLHLALNACDAMPDGGVLSFKTDNAVMKKNACDLSSFDIVPGKYISVTVEDNGIGMDEETIKNVFEPFFTTKGHSKGTGMGLAAVYGIVENHSGSINITSNKGAGTEVMIHLPLGEDTSEEQVETPTTHSTNVTIHILLIDDEESILESFNEILVLEGYKVTAFDNEITALEFYKKSWETIDFILLDIGLSEINGEHIFDLLRKINKTAKVILWSGDRYTKKVEELITNGALAYLEKAGGVDTFINIFSQIVNTHL